MREYDINLINILSKNVKTTTYNESEVFIKPIPEYLNSDGILDPRELEMAKKTLANRLKNTSNKNIESMREHSLHDTADLCDKEVIKETINLKYKKHEFKVFSYHLPGGFDDKPCVIFIHGGSFFAGGAINTENPMRFLAQESNAIVFNIEYGLAPENPYPIALKEILKTYKYIIHNSKRLHIDKNKIVIGGASSGANFAAVIANKLTNKRIALQVLYYPVVYLGLDVTPFVWDINEYKISKEYENYIIPRLNLGRADEKGDQSYIRYIFKLYNPKNIDVHKKEFSPINANLSKTPRTLIFTAEYDGLRIQAEYYSSLLKQHNIDVNTYRYNGIHHGFLNKFGLYPQAEDSLLIFADMIKKL
ncbi:MAG: alpha/beta hydrolase [Bacilli bacterium]